MNKIEMRNLDKEKRITNFDEVALGYNEEEAIAEASRCLNCRVPNCQKGCPVKINIPKFISLIKEKKLEEAYDVISEDSLFPAICGRVCPQESQCEKYCVQGFRGDAVSIGALERYVADEHLKNDIKKNVLKEKLNKRVAIVGSGPSGLACAAYLSSSGVDVTIFEALNKAGGVLVYGIPEFRLPKEIVRKEIANLENLGVKFELNTVIGKSKSLSDLKQAYDAVYIASGAGVPKFMGIPNENAVGVFSANEILTRINLMGAYKKESNTPLYDAKNIIVVGGGNVACDAARSLRRMGADVTICYRRSITEMPARKMEVEHAIEEGIKILELTSPVSVIAQEDVATGLECVKMELLESIGNGRREVKAIDGTNFKIDADMIVMALGTDANIIATMGENIERDSKGIIINEDTMTNMDNVYAGGDAVTGSATVILAMEAGKKSAVSILESFKSC